MKKDSLKKFGYVLSVLEKRRRSAIVAPVRVRGLKQTHKLRTNANNLREEC